MKQLFFVFKLAGIANVSFTVCLKSRTENCDDRRNDNVKQSEYHSTGQHKRCSHAYGKHKACVERKSTNNVMYDVTESAIQIFY